MPYETGLLIHKADAEVVMEIEARQASLSTMAVTINALHVNGKQMTLSVFRQLPIAQEDEHSELWGVVRYKIKHEGEVWIVFSKNGILMRRALSFKAADSYRDEIYEAKDGLDFYEKQSEELTDVGVQITKARVHNTKEFPNVVLLACDQDKQKAGRLWSEWVSKAWNTSSRESSVLIAIRAMQLNQKDNEERISKQPPWIKEDRDRLRSELSDEEEKLVSGFERMAAIYKEKQKEYERKLERVMQKEADRQAREHELAEMPQLFIAV